MERYKIELSHPYSKNRTFIITGSTEEDAIDSSFDIWRREAGNISNYNIPKVESCVKLEPTARIFRMIYELPGHTNQHVMMVTASDEEDGRDECMAEIYRFAGPAWTSVNTGVVMVPRELYFEEL